LTVTSCASSVSDSAMLSGSCRCHAALKFQARGWRLRRLGSCLGISLKFQCVMPDTRPRPSAAMLDPAIHAAPGTAIIMTVRGRIALADALPTARTNGRLAVTAWPRCRPKRSLIAGGLRHSDGWGWRPLRVVIGYRLQWRRSAPPLRQSGSARHAREGSVARAVNLHHPKQR
jgi:hypothetical protein